MHVHGQEEIKKIEKQGPGGGLESVSFYKGKLPDSTWVSYYPSGKLRSISNYNAGKKHGEWATYYENGQHSTRADLNEDNIQGEVHFFDQQGNIQGVLIYQGGRLQGYTYEDETGNLKTASPVVGVEAIACKYRNGSTSLEATLTNGKITEPFVVFDLATGAASNRSLPGSND